MAFATYLTHNPRPGYEFSVSIIIPKPGYPVGPYGAVPLGPHSHNEVVALPPNVPRRVNLWAAIYLAGLRKRGGPWFRVQLERGEWQEIQARAGDWIRKARDAVALVNPEVSALAVQAAVRPYQTL